MSEFTKTPQTRRRRSQAEDPSSSSKPVARPRRAARSSRKPRQQPLETKEHILEQKTLIYEEKVEPVQYYFPSGERTPKAFKPKPEAEIQEKPSRQRSRRPLNQDSEPRRGGRKESPRKENFSKPRNEPRNPKAERSEKPYRSKREPSERGDRNNSSAQPVSAAKHVYDQFFIKNVYKSLGGIKGLRQQAFLGDAASMQKAAQVDASAVVLDLNQLRSLELSALMEYNQEHEAKITRGTKAMLVGSALNQALEAQRILQVEGILELLEEGDALLLASDDNYKLSRFSVYIPRYWMEHYGLRRGQTLRVQATGRPNSDGAPLWAYNVLSVEGMAPEAAKALPHFEKLEAYYPTRRIFVEQDPLSDRDRLSMRAVDLLTPIGLGQRALIVAPPRAGKTLLLQGMARAIRAAEPEAELIVLLVDERPEEIADFRDAIQGEVISSTFDEPPESHIHISELVIEKARKRVEAGRHVILFLDSITRLARAHNALMGKGGRTLSGGVDALALQNPRRFFSSARNIEGGGSLTIIATVLVETESRMDDIIFEEIKGTGNMELHLDSDLANKRIFPAIHWEKSGTRKEELLYHPQELEKIYALRRLGKGVPPPEAMQLLLKRLKQTRSNAEFLMGLDTV